MTPLASLRPAMSRRSLRPQLNQIRGWVRQGRTDAWIAHQLEVTVQQIQAFKREQGLEADGEENGGARLRGDRPARLRRRRDRGRARGRGRAARRRGGQGGRGGRPQGRRGGGEGEAGEAERRGRGRRQAEARPRALARRPQPQAHRRAAARGHVRPRRGGLRPLAGPGRAGRPRLRRALGRPPAGRGHDRGGSDRDPPCRRRRGRRRLTPGSAARARAFDAGVFERAAEQVVRSTARRCCPTPSLPRSRT